MTDEQVLTIVFAIGLWGSAIFSVLVIIASKIKLIEKNTRQP